MARRIRFGAPTAPEAVEGCPWVALTALGGIREQPQIRPDGGLTSSRAAGRCPRWLCAGAYHGHATCIGSRANAARARRPFSETNSIIDR